MDAVPPKPRRYRHPLKRLLAGCEVEVDSQLGEGTRPGRIHKKRCLSTAFAYADSHRRDGPVLCHGMVLFGSARRHFLHAWVEMPGEVVFDGMVQMFYSRREYYRRMGVDPERVWRYAPAEVERLSMQTRHTGPWHEEG